MDEVRGHFIEVISHGFACSCGNSRTDATSKHDSIRLAAQHQLAAFVRGVVMGEIVATSCLGCGAKMSMPESNSEGLMHDYADWIAQPCPACGRAPREVVAEA